MLEGVADIPAEYPGDGAQKPSERKVKLLTLDDLDKRTTAARVARSTRDQVCTDLGGADRLTTLELIQVDNVALTAAMLTDLRARWLQGEQVDVATVATLQNVFNRTAASLGFKRRSRDVTPDLHDYIGKPQEDAR